MLHKDMVDDRRTSGVYSCFAHTTIMSHRNMARFGHVTFSLFSV